MQHDDEASNVPLQAVGDGIYFPVTIYALDAGLQTRCTQSVSAAIPESADYTLSLHMHASNPAPMATRPRSTDSKVVIRPFQHQTLQPSVTTLSKER